MQLSEFRTAIRSRLGVPATDSFFTDTALTDIANAAIQQIAGEFDWPWLEATETINTTNGTATYSTDASSARTISVIDPTGVPLKRMPIDELSYLGAATGGYVRFYAVVGSTLHVRPVPNTALALTHYYVDTEAALSNDADTPTLPAQWHDAWVAYGMVLAYTRANRAADAQAALALYNDWVATMKSQASRFAVSKGGGAEVAPNAAQ